MGKIWNKYKNYIFLLGSSNITGVLSLLFTIIILKIANQQTYNEFIVYSSLFMIFTTPGKIFKNLANSYGDCLFTQKIKSIFSRYTIWIALFLIAIGIILFYTPLIFRKGIIVLIFASLIQMLVLFFGGLIQNKKGFLFTSVGFFLQNLLKISLGIYLLSIIGNFGIWLSYLFVSTFTFLAFYYKYSSQPILKAKFKDLNFKDLLINLVLFVLIEILLNIDTIIVTYRLPQTDAYFYNTILIIKKTFLTIVLGVSPIILAQARDNNKNKFSILYKNIFVSTVLAGGLSIALLLGFNYISTFLSVGSASFLVYLKLITASFLGVIVLVIGVWFTSYRQNRIRLALMGILVVYIILYIIFVHSIDNALDYYIIGNIIVILYQVGLIRLNKKK